MSCSQIWNIEQRKDREKEKVGGRPAKFNEEKGDRDLEREREREKKKEKKRSEREKYDMSSIKMCNQLRSFWKFHVVVVQNNGKDKYKRCAARAKLLFC